VASDAVDRASEPEEITKALSGSDRVLATLNLLGSFPNGVGLNDLARLLDSPRSSVHRALAALRRADFVEQDLDGRYRLGYGLLKLAFSYYDTSDDMVRIRPVLAALADRFGETAHYALLDGTEVVYLAKVQPATSRYQLNSVIGGRNPAYCTGVGKALLAFTLSAPEAVAEFVAEVGEPMHSYTSHTIVTAAALSEELERIRDVGYAVDREEHEEGVNCLAIPLFLTSEVKPDGAVSVTAVARRLPLSELEASVDEARDIIRHHLGEVLQ
jgi:IclR family transcriptional regulator, acetate operon repressor